MGRWEVQRRARRGRLSQNQLAPQVLPQPRGAPARRRARGGREGRGWARSRHTAGGETGFPGTGSTPTGQGGWGSSASPWGLVHADCSGKVGGQVSFLQARPFLCTFHRNTFSSTMFPSPQHLARGWPSPPQSRAPASRPLGNSLAVRGLCLLPAPRVTLRAFSTHAVLGSGRRQTDGVGRAPLLHFTD